MRAQGWGSNQYGLVRPLQSGSHGGFGGWQWCCCQSCPWKPLWCSAHAGQPLVIPPSAISLRIRETYSAWPERAIRERERERERREERGEREMRGGERRERETREREREREREERERERERRGGKTWVFKKTTRRSGKQSNLLQYLGSINFSRGKQSNKVGWPLGEKLKLRAYKTWRVAGVSGRFMSWQCQCRFTDQRAFKQLLQCRFTAWTHVVWT